MRTLTLLSALLVLAACGGGGGGGGAAVPGWITAPPDPVVAPIADVDTSAAGTVITDADDAAQAEAKLRQVLLVGGVVRVDRTSTLTITPATRLEVAVGTTAVIDGRDRLVLNGAGTTVSPSDATLSGILLKQYNATLTVQRVAFINGRAPDLPNGPDGSSDFAGSGGAINTAWEGSLTVIGCSFTDCDADQSGPDTGGGAIRAGGQRVVRVHRCTFTDCSGANGGAINTLGSQLDLVACTFTNCRATGTGGGGGAGASGQGGIGGALYVDNVSGQAAERSAVLQSCTFTDCTATDHGGMAFIYTTPGDRSTVLVNGCQISNCRVTAATPQTGFGGGLYTMYAATTIVNTTIAGCSTTKSGGGLVIQSSERVRLANCTISGNSAVSSGGIHLENADAWISHCTIADNSSANWSAGLRLSSAGGTRLKNVLLANNEVTTNGDFDTNRYNGWNINASAIDGGGNVQWPRDRLRAGEISLSPIPDTPMTAGVVWADPQLEALGSYGGPTQTRRLPTGSAAINAGAAGGAPDSDQRGEPRSNGLPDVGAFERQVTGAG